MLDHLSRGCRGSNFRRMPSRKKASVILLARSTSHDSLKFRRALRSPEHRTRTLMGTMLKPLQANLLDVCPLLGRHRRITCFRCRCSLGACMKAILEDPSSPKPPRGLLVFVDRRNDGQTSVWRLECEMA